MKKLIFSVLLVFWSSTLMAAGYSGLGEDSVSTDVLKTYQPPVVKKELARKIQSLMDLRAPGMGMVTNNGKKLFFGWRVTGTPQIWRLDNPNGFPIQMTGGEDRTELLGITPDGQKIVLSRDQAGQENPGIYWQSVDGGPLQVIQHKAKVQTNFDFISDDSQYVYFHANDQKENSFSIYRFNFKTQKVEPVFSQEGLWFIADHRQDELLLGLQKGSLRTEYFLWKVGSANPPTPLVGQNESEEYTVLMAAKPNEYIVLTPKFGEFRRVYLLKNGEYKPISAEINWDVSEIAIDGKRKRLYLQINEAGYSKIQVLNAQNFKPIKIPNLPKEDNVTFGLPTPNGRFVSLATYSSKSPQRSYVLDWNSQKLTAWTIPSAPEIDLNTFVKPTLEYYPAADGTKIPMFVYRPPGCVGDSKASKVCPVIVSFHGGPEGQSQPWFQPLLQLYLESGFIYVEPNVRGSDGYGKSWINSDNGPKRLNVITDIRDCAEFIRKNWGRNGVAPKIGVVGASYGGYSSQMAMTMFAGSYDAGVSSVGMSNLLTFLNNTAPYRRILRMSEYGDPQKDAEALKKLSPITYVDQVKAPMLFIQGLNDPRVPVGEALQMHESLVKRKIPSQLIIFPDEGHSVTKRDNQVKSFGAQLDFFKQHLM